MKIKKNLVLMILFLSCSIFFFNLTDCLSDSEFVTLIKNMAIKNHSDPDLFKKVYNEATSAELKKQKYLTKLFYECIYQNQDYIKTKSDINRLCGQFITFK